MSALVTVLMPVFNAEQFIKTAINSVLLQTFTNFEFLIIDDGSTDKSVEIIRSYADKRIRLIQNDANQGISASLNKGIKLCRTELIARMDADDICYPERLQKQYQYFFENVDCTLLSTSVREISKEGNPIKINSYTTAYYYYNLTFICWIYHPTVMFKASVVNEVGGYGVPYSEDFDLWWKILRQYKIFHLEEVLLDYRVHKKSLSAGYKKTAYDDCQHLQVERNINYYTKESIALTYEEIESLRFNFTPLLIINSSVAVNNLLKKLKIISKCISETDNINLDKQRVEEAHYHKRMFTFSYFVNHLTPYKAVWLLISNGYFISGVALIISQLISFKCKLVKT